MGADLQGGLGYSIERVLRSKLRAAAWSNRACCMLTMVEVDANDPAFGDPTKFVGPRLHRRRRLRYAPASAAGR